MEKETAKEIKEHALKAIENLSGCLITATNKCSKEEFETLKKGVGMSIMKIDDMLDIIYNKYPELDDLEK